MTDFDKLDSIPTSPTTHDHVKTTSRAGYFDDVDTVENGTQNVTNQTKVWSQAGSAFFPSEETVNTLPPGYYTVETSQRGIFFQRHPMNLDELLVLPDTASEEILQHIDFFLTRKEKFRELGFLWKRGIMLYGPAGGGKTSTLQLLSKMFIDRNGISIYLTNPDRTATGLKLLRRIEPHRPLIVLIEDIDAIINNYGESDLLALLDGELQIDNVVFIATTNYPEDLDRRFKNRPSRFDVVKKIGLPIPEARAVYLRAKNPRLRENEAELKKWVNATKDYTIAHLKEVILAVEALDEPFDDVIARLNKMQTQKLHSDQDKESSFGFRP